LLLAQIEIARLESSGDVRSELKASKNNRRARANIISAARRKRLEGGAGELAAVCPKHLRSITPVGSPFMTPQL
jgi:hypothetical protein